MIRLGTGALVNPDHYDELKGLLQEVLLNLPDYMAEKFDADLMLEGFSSFLKHSTKVEQFGWPSHQSYKDWYKNFASTSESNKLFSKFFQNLQIRTCSEVCFYITVCINI